MVTSKRILIGLTLLLTTGCIQPSTDGKINYNTQTNKPLTFHTNEHSFIHSLKDSSTLEERNSYLDEFLLKSDMQCANYLNKPLQKPIESHKNDSLYVSIADTVSTIFGLNYITNTAKAVFLDKETKNRTEERNAYANALSPEMRKGVEIGRARFAKELQKRKALPLEKYTINQLKSDTLKYDKQCNLEYGLIEINRALKDMQHQINTEVVVKKEPKLTLDPKTIKAKVEQATQEVEAKKIEVKKTEEERVEIKKEAKMPTSKMNI